MKIVHKFYLPVCGTSESSGLGSPNSDEIESKTFGIVSTGDQPFVNVSIQIKPVGLRGIIKI